MHKLILAIKNFIVVSSNKCLTTCKLKPKCSSYIVAVIMLIKITMINISKSLLSTLKLHTPVDNNPVLCFTLNIYTIVWFLHLCPGISDVIMVWFP